MPPASGIMPAAKVPIRVGEMPIIEFIAVYFNRILNAPAADRPLNNILNIVLIIAGDFGWEERLL